MIIELGIETHAEGSGRGMIQVLPRNFSRGPEKSHEIRQDSLCPGRDSNQHFF
jgi:hypothetical protein